jgi:biopolymer transport protein ExbB
MKMGSFSDFLRENVGHVLPIIIAGVVALAIIVERLRALYWVYPIANEKKFFEGIQEHVMKGKLAEAMAICERYPSKPVAQVVKTALLRAHQPKDLIEDGLALVVEESNQLIQRRTHFLAMIANVATLLGLLGTIVGLIASFDAVSTDNPGEKTALLAKGISTAMNATMMGLGVAVPCMVMFSFLINRTNRLVSSVETSAIRMVDLLKQRYFENEVRVVGRKESA